jgi:hypothetical protein
MLSMVLYVKEHPVKLVNNNILYGTIIINLIIKSLEI